MVDVRAFIQILDRICRNVSLVVLRSRNVTMRLACELTGESTSLWQQLIFRLYRLLLKHSVVNILRVWLTFDTSTCLRSLRCPWGPAEDNGDVMWAPSPDFGPFLLVMDFMTPSFNSSNDFVMFCHEQHESILTH